MGFGPGRGRIRGDQDVNGMGSEHSGPLQGTVLAWRTARSPSTMRTTPMLSMGISSRIAAATRSKTSCSSRVSEAISAMSERTLATDCASMVETARPIVLPSMRSWVLGDQNFESGLVYHFPRLPSEFHTLGLTGDAPSGPHRCEGQGHHENQDYRSLILQAHVVADHERGDEPRSH